MDEKEQEEAIGLLSFSKAAKKMGIGKDTLGKLIQSGKIGVIQAGKRNKIAVREIIRYIDKNTFRVAQPVKVQNNPLYKEIKSTDEIFYDTYEEVTGKVHPGRLRKMRAADLAAQKSKKKNSRG